MDDNTEIPEVKMPETETQEIPAPEKNESPKTSNFFVVTTVLLLLVVAGVGAYYLGQKNQQKGTTVESAQTEVTASPLAQTTQTQSPTPSATPSASPKTNPTPPNLKVINPNLKLQIKTSPTPTPSSTLLPAKARLDLSTP